MGLTLDSIDAVDTRDGKNGLNQDATAVRLAGLVTQLEALQAAPDFQVGGPTWARFCELEAEWSDLVEALPA